MTYYIRTRSGAQFWPLDPRPDDIRLDDIASAISKKCRFNGHCHPFYSVAEHSVRGADIAAAIYGKAAAFAFIIHDAHEAFTGDLVTPIKRTVPVFKELEGLAARAVAKRYGTEEHLYDARVKDVDIRMLSTEIRDLTTWDHVSEVPGVEPFDFKIVPVGIEEAYNLWLDAFFKYHPDPSVPGSH